MLSQGNALMNQRISGLVLVVALIASASPASAQWMWLNENGIKHLADQPPPASAPPNRILKAPPAQMPDLRKELNPPAADPDAAPAEAPAPKAKPRLTLAERNADYNKRRVESAEK